MAPTHEECRHRVCILCMNKAKQPRPINDDAWQVIQQHFVEGLRRDDNRLPVVLCMTCYTAICDIKRTGVTTRPIQPFDYTKIVSKMPTRNRNCCCLVCEVATAVPSALSAATGAAAIPQKKKADVQLLFLIYEQLLLRHAPLVSQR